VATPGVERTHPKHGIRSLILNYHAGAKGNFINSYFKFQGTLLEMLSMVVEDIRDRPLFFAGREEKFETFLSAQAENLQIFFKHGMRC